MDCLVIPFLVRYLPDGILWPNCSIIVTGLECGSSRKLPRLQAYGYSTVKMSWIGIVLHSSCLNYPIQRTVTSLMIRTGATYRANCQCMVSGGSNQLRPQDQESAITSVSHSGDPFLNLASKA